MLLQFVVLHCSDAQSNVKPVFINAQLQFITTPIFYVLLAMEQHICAVQVLQFQKFPKQLDWAAGHVGFG